MISIYIPCLNEEQFIETLIEAIANQTIDSRTMEVIVVDGMSTDCTREKVAIASKRFPELCVRLVDNPQKDIPHALNIGLKESTGQYLIRMDAHSLPAYDYVEKCVELLKEGVAQNVGGRWIARPRVKNFWGRSIAVSIVHPLGSGGADYRSGTIPRYVDTVPFGAITRETFERVGLFNEALLANEDYEWNTRLRNQGGKIWFDPSIECTYFPRGSIKLLARQYYKYGYWKWQMLRLFPRSLRIRQLAPTVTLLLLLTGLLAAIDGFYLNNIYIIELGLLPPILYMSLLLIGALFHRNGEPLWLVPGITIALATMHISWAFGFVRSLASRKTL